MADLSPPALGGNSQPENTELSGSGGGDASSSHQVTEATQTVPQPYILRPGLAPVPPRLVAKIQKLAFVDMAELLRDNLEMQRREDSQGQQTLSTPACIRRREIPDLLSWVSCFGVYMAVLCSKHPGMIKQLLAYQTTIIREARRCGGNGWLQYDSFFRQQVAGNPDADWSSLNTSLYAVTFLAQGGKGGQSCASCMEADHTQQDCAMSGRRPRSPTPKRRAYQPPDPYTPDRGKRRSVGTCCFAWNQGECRMRACFVLVTIQ